MSVNLTPASLNVSISINEKPSAPASNVNHACCDTQEPNDIGRSTHAGIHSQNQNLTQMIDSLSLMSFFRDFLKRLLGVGGDRSNSQAGQGESGRINISIKIPQGLSTKSLSSPLDIATKTIKEFQASQDLDLISYDDVKEMADRKTFHGQPVSSHVQSAAQLMMQDNGKLFDAVESATDGKHDSMLSQGDPEQASKKGIIGTLVSAA